MARLLLLAIVASVAGCRTALVIDRTAGSAPVERQRHGEEGTLPE